MDVYKVVATQTTAVDLEEGYATETLGEALANEHSCYHLARIAHLYFSRTGPQGLSNQDYAEHIPKLFDKIFGVIPVPQNNQNGNSAVASQATGNTSNSNLVEDFGWLERQCGAADAPRSNFAELRQSLVKTFDKKKISRHQRAAYRLCQLLDCYEKGTFCDLVFGQMSANQRLCIYYLPDKLLPDYVRIALSQTFAVNLAPGGMEGMVNTKLPGLYMNLSLMQRDKIGVQRSGSLALDMQEFYLFRFFCWFKFAKIKTEPLCPSGLGTKPSYTTGYPLVGTTTLPTSIQGLQQKTVNSSSSNANKTASPSEQSGFWKLNIPDMMYRCPALELLERYLRYFMPHEHIRQQQSRLTQEQGYAGADNRSQWLFLNIMLEMWFSQVNVNTPVVAQAGYGSMTYSAVQSQSQYGQPTYGQAFPSGSGSMTQKVTFLMLKGILIVMNHLFRDPIIYTELDNNVGKVNVGGVMSVMANQETLGLLGTTPVLQVMRPYLYNFFLQGLSTVNKQPLSTSDEIAFVPLLDSWLLFLQPWKAEARSHDVPKPKKHSLMADAASLRNRFTTSANMSLKAGLGLGLGTGKNDAPTSQHNSMGGALKENYGSNMNMNTNPLSHSNNKTASGADAGAKKNEPQRFTPGWVWFVVQHYLMYAHLLQVVFKRLQDHSVSSDELSAIVRAFSLDDNGPFNDCIIAILRACEVIILDAVQMTQTNIFTALSETIFPYLNKSRLDLNSSAFDSSVSNPRRTPSQPGAGIHGGPKSSTATQDELAKMIVTIIQTLESKRMLAINILKKQFAELRWDLAITPLPLISHSQPVVGNILQQMNWQQQNKKKLKTAGVNGKSGLGGMGGMAFQWAENQLASHSPVNMIQNIQNISLLHPMASTRKFSDEELLKMAMNRMYRIFEVPPMKDTKTTKQDTGKLSKVVCPDSMLATATPPWLGKDVQCVYKRLTAKGRKQVVEANCDTKNIGMSYIGDPLVNPPPICTYEIAFLVRLLHQFSLFINRTLGLRSPAQFRVNLRIFADIRLLLLMDLFMMFVGGIFWGFGLFLPGFIMFVITLISLLIS